MRAAAAAAPFRPHAIDWPKRISTGTNAARLAILQLSLPETRVEVGAPHQPFRLCAFYSPSFSASTSKNRARILKLTALPVWLLHCVVVDKVTALWSGHINALAPALVERLGGGVGIMIWYDRKASAELEAW